MVFLLIRNLALKIDLFMWTVAIRFIRWGTTPAKCCHILLYNLISCRVRYDATSFEDQGPIGCHLNRNWLSGCFCFLLSLLVWEIREGTWWAILHLIYDGFRVTGFHIYPGPLIRIENSGKSVETLFRVDTHGRLPNNRYFTIAVMLDNFLFAHNGWDAFP